MIDFGALQSDPEFSALPFTEKVKAVASLDPDFARLAPEEQHKGLAQLFPPDARDSINERQNFPGPTAKGDTNSNADNNGLSIHDIGAAIGHGLAHFIGVPTNRQELIDKYHSLAQGGPLNPLAIPKMIYGAGHDLIAGNDSPVPGSTTEQVLGHVPVVGRALQAVAAPAAAYANGQAPSRDQNMGAVESGTQLGATAALMHPAVAGAIESGIGKVGGALDRGATSTYADALAPKGSEMRPLAETIGDQLLAKGKTMSDPRTQLRTAFDENRGPQISETDVEKFIPKKNPNRVAEQLQALKDAHPGADIVDNGKTFTIRELKPAAERVSVDQQGADTLAAAMPSKAAPANGLGRDLGAAAVGSLVKGIPGAQAAVGMMEAGSIMQRMVQSPLWKTTSAVVKKQVGQAMMDGDFQKVAAIGAQVLGGENLDDEHGHDAALHGLINSVTQGQHVPPDQLQQLLQGHIGLYANPNGTTVEVPHHVLQQTFQQLTTGDPSAMADKNAFLGQMNNFDTTKADTAEVQRRFSQ